MMSEEVRTILERDGFVLLPATFSQAEVAHFAKELAAAFASAGEREGIMRSSAGVVYGARNVLALWPPGHTAWRKAALEGVLASLLGPSGGLVRALYFDKPPDQTWALPWHKDLTIAVRDNRLPSERFAKPTRKAGVPHVEAPVEVLKGMLTVRIHLDRADESNGALHVLPGSHHTGTRLELNGQPRLVEANAGDVLLMRPLLAHASDRSAPDVQRQRRILHLEFANREELPDGYHWHGFVPL